MNPEPADVDRHSILFAHARLPTGEEHDWSVGSMTKQSHSFTLVTRIRALATELRRHDSEWADRLCDVSSERELLNVVASLFNLSHALEPSRKQTDDDVLSRRISAFVRTNLRKGLTLKLLARFLGYSEKYCSDLFQATMGESFSGYLKRQRIERAEALLKTTDKGVADIATAIGFSDQFAFSHFFKRETGRSPIQFRSSHRRRSPKRSRLPSKESP